MSPEEIEKELKEIHKVNDRQDQVDQRQDREIKRLYEDMKGLPDSIERIGGSIKSIEKFLKGSGFGEPGFFEYTQNELSSLKAKVAVLEKAYWIGLGGLAAIQALIGWFL